jgi:hypothetical protein
VEASGLPRCRWVVSRKTASQAGPPPPSGGRAGGRHYIRARARARALFLFFSKSFFFSRRANYLISRAYCIRPEDIYHADRRTFTTRPEDIYHADRRTFTTRGDRLKKCPQDT